MEAETLKCPQCGAAVSSDSTRCAYCQALLETVACPKCMGMMFVGTEYCPHCGQRTATIGLGPLTKHDCPRCAVELEKVQVVSTTLEECTKCGGLWVDVSNFDRICSDAESREAVSGLKLPPAVELNTTVRYLKCPQCGDMMGRINYAERSGIILNVCRPHGIWLDREEMRLIVRFISSGGLDRARKVELEELQDAQRASDPQWGMLAQGILHKTSVKAFNSDERVHLLRGVASVINHFLGDSGPL